MANPAAEFNRLDSPSPHLASTPPAYILSCLSLACFSHNIKPVAFAADFHNRDTSSDRGPRWHSRQHHYQTAVRKVLRAESRVSSTRNQHSLPGQLAPHQGSFAYRAVRALCPAKPGSIAGLRRRRPGSSQVRSTSHRLANCCSRGLLNTSPCIAARLQLPVGATATSKHCRPEFRTAEANNTFVLRDLSCSWAPKLELQLPGPPVCCSVDRLPYPPSSHHPSVSSWRSAFPSRSHPRSRCPSARPIGSPRLTPSPVSHAQSSPSIAPKVPSCLLQGRSQGRPIALLTSLLELCIFSSLRHPAAAVHVAATVAQAALV
ncbi:hypothetical protein QBC47DRAFT_97670 [Echria macrotheca]|uniref:Uncharacterized protein n=1 Tax=Echria macrotheca TaxID=438768 RepID=A0AAJ0FD59_9PEZI|nr:hypothetical protein QBC47DRAFT_97670 [Echria macrotheca]